MTPSDIGNVDSGGRVKMEIYQQVCFLGTDTFQPKIFNISIGKTVKWHYYLVPLQYERNAEDMRYYVACFCKEESIAELEARYAAVPKAETGTPLEYTGIAEEMSVKMKNWVTAKLQEHPSLVGVERPLENPLVGYYYNRIIPWVVYEKEDVSPYQSALICGGVMCLTAVAVTTILIVKIHSEKNWY